MEAAHPQVKSYYEECCCRWHLCMMKRVFCHSTLLSEQHKTCLCLPATVSSSSFHLNHFWSTIPSHYLKFPETFFRVAPIPPRYKELYRAHLHYRDCWRRPQLSDPQAASQPSMASGTASSTFVLHLSAKPLRALQSARYIIGACREITQNALASEH